MKDAEQIIENELALQRPEVRRDQAAVLALLAPDFVEIDATGRTWTPRASPPHSRRRPTT